jgi:hypothetical protein
MNAAPESPESEGLEPAAADESTAETAEPTENPEETKPQS